MALDSRETINWYQDVVSHKSEATARYQFMVRLQSKATNRNWAVASNVLLHFLVLDYRLVVSNIVIAVFAVHPSHG